MKKRWIIFIIVAVGVIGGSVWFAISERIRNKATPMPDTAVTTETPAWDVAPIVSGMQNIWEVAFLPSGEMLFDERGGTIHVRADGRVQEVARIDDVYARGESGLMGLAVDPLFTQNRYIYACFASKNPSDVRVVRWHLDQSLTSLRERRDIVTGIPLNTASFPGRHSGCRLTFGPDGYLWVGTGDAALGPTGMQPQSLGGKVLRVDRDGKAAPDNLGAPYDKRVFSYGHRNVQGLAFFAAPKNGVLGLSIEHGSTVDDEVNELQKGNFGWAPPANYNERNVPMTDKSRFPDAISAIWSSGDPTQAPSGGTILNGTAWRGWNGALAMAVQKGQHLKILRLNDQNKVIREERILSGEYGRLRTAVQGPDGSLYIATDNHLDDQILQLTPKP